MGFMVLDPNNNRGHQIDGASEKGQKYQAVRIFGKDRWKTCREKRVSAHETGDESTVVLVPDRMRVHEKTAWMLRALQ